MRLDNYLVEKGLFQSRTKAQESIKKGYVLVNDKIIKKSAFEVSNNDKINIKEHTTYVSRAAWKLKGFLDEIDITIAKKRALDIGSSTGGFSEVLLQEGASSVVAVDVGTNQFDKNLRKNPKVELYEQTDIRDFYAESFDIVVSDVSFISLLKIIDSVDRLAKKDIILLFKPQFEVGIGVKRDKKGVVVDKKAIDEAMQRFEEATKKLGWKLLKKAPSKLTGKDGNLEYCYYFSK